MKKASRAPPPPRLPNNGEIEVWYGGDDPAHPTTMTHHTLQTIHYRLDEDTGVATCTLNDPARLNPLSTCQIWEYNLVLKHAARDERVRVLLWTGHGRAFSAGADLRGQAEPLSLDSAAVAWFIAQGFDPGAKSGDVALKCLTLAFWDFPKLSVVAVNGLAIGGAANVALANYHDIVVASTDAYFKYPFSDIGLTPELGSSYMLPRMVGMARAKALLMLGDKLTAHEAKDMGLVLEVTTPDQLLPRARHYAEVLASKHEDALILSKKLINSHLREKIEAVLDVENAFFHKVISNFTKASKL